MNEPFRTGLQVGNMGSGRGSEESHQISLEGCPEKMREKEARKMVTEV